jgi:hypothetical protein
MLIQAAEGILAECERRISETQTTLDRLLLVTSLQSWLGTKHRQVFDDWLSSSLEEQYDMLAPRYRGAAQSDSLTDEAFSLTAFSKLIPSGGIEEGPRILFYSNLDLVLEVLREELPFHQTSGALASGSPESAPDGLSLLLAVCGGPTAVAGSR